MDTLLCDLGLSPKGIDSCGSPLYDRAASPMGTLLINAFCGGGVAASACQSGPMGSCRTQWRAGFEGLPDSAIVGQNSNPVYPSGMANNLAGALLVNCASQCFP